MSTKRSIQVAPLIAILGISLALENGAEAAETWTSWGPITSLEPGWRLDTMAVWHSAPMTNPDGCPVSNAGYATDPSDPGHTLFHTVMLSAFLNHKDVRFLLSGCIYNKPHIIAVGVR